MGSWQKSRRNNLSSLKRLSKYFLLLFLIVAFSSTAPLAAEELSGTVGVREWYAGGDNEWNFSGAGINVLSDLRWRGVDTLVTEFYGDLFWRRLGLLASVGFAGIDNGVLIDDDFAEPNRRGRFSHTRSGVKDGEVLRLTVDFAGRLFEWEKPLIGEKPAKRLRGYLDLLLGYQYWHEEYVAFGAQGDAQISSGIKVLTHDYWWHTLRLGARTGVPVVGDLSLKSHVIWSPYVDYELEDIHHLRTDLRKNPSFSSESTDGWGVELDVAVSYRLWQGLAVEAGYRYSRIDSGEGDKFTHALTGTTRDGLNNTTFERYGPHIAVQYRW